MRKTLLTLTAAAALALAGAPAYAQGTVSPTAPSCAEALITFKAAQKKLNATPSGAKLDEAVEVDGRVVAAVKAVEDARPPLAAAEAELAAAVAEDNATVPPATVDSDRAKTAKTAVVDAQAELAAAEGALASIRGTVRGELEAALAGVKTERDDAKAAADTACKGEPGTPGTPGEPGAPGAPAAPVNEDDDFTQVGADDVPVGGVDTGA